MAVTPAITLDFGNVPAWFTLGAVIVALATLVTGRLDAARQPAAHVYAIVVDFRLRDSSTPFTAVAVYNEGDFPIFEPSVHLWNWGRVRRYSWRLWPIEWWLTSLRKQWANGSHLPARTCSEVVCFKGLPPKEYDPKTSPTPPIVLTFRDGSGRLWVRWPNGRLRRISPSRWRSTRPKRIRQPSEPAELRVGPPSDADQNRRDVLRRCMEGAIP